MKDIMFIGIFFEEIKKGKLSNCNNKGGQHVTLVYKPTKEQWEALKNYIGKEVVTTINKYGNDNKNEGFGVEIDESIPYFGAEQKHITLSIAEGAKAVNTAFIEMNEIEPFTVVGKIGFIDFDGIVHF